MNLQVHLRRDAVAKPQYPQIGKASMRMPPNKTLSQKLRGYQYKCLRYKRPSKPYEFMRFGAMDVTKPYKFIWFGDIPGSKTYDPDTR